MKGKNLAVLLVLAAVLVGAALLTSRRREPPAPERIGKPVLPDLAVNDITRITLTAADSTATLARVEGTWEAPARHGYPADFGRIRDFLLKLADLTVGQVVVVTAAQRPALGLVPPEAPAPPAAPAEGAGPAERSTGMRVDLYGAGDMKLASLLVGRTHTRKPQDPEAFYGAYPDGQYVSPDGGQTVFLVSEILDRFSASLRDWLDAQILNVPAADLREITIGGPGRDELRLSREAPDQALQAEGLAENEEADRSRISGIESALSYLRFEDIADPTLTDEALGMTTAVVCRAVTHKGEIYTARIGGSPAGSSSRYVRLEAALEPPPPEAPPAAAAPAEAAAETPADTNVAAAATNDLAAAEVRAAERRQIEEAVAATNRKLAPWTFVIESFRTDSMTTARTAVVKPKAEESKAEQADEEEQEEDSRPPEPPREP
jgi:hypothetical protein